MARTEVEYQAVDESDGSPKKEDGGRSKLEEEKKEEGEKKTYAKKKKRKKTKEEECNVIKEEEDEDEDLKTDSNDADSNNNPSPTRRPNIFRRTMSFLASLPRKIYTYVREVFYSPREHWTKVGQDDSEESDWSSSEDAGTSRANKHKRSTAQSPERHRPKTNKAAPPPVAPKPKKKDATNGHTAGSGSSNPPSSPDTTSPDTTPEISFDDIPIDSPQLKPYKRIHGPQGRRKPQRFSNQNEIRQSEIRHETDVLR